MTHLRALGLAYRFDSVLVADLPRILHPLWFSAVFQSDHIKTQVRELALTLLHPPKLRAAGDAALFQGGNALKCTAVAAVVPQADFHNDGSVALRHDQIDFTAAATVISGDQEQAFGFQQTKSLCLGLLTLSQNLKFVRTWLLVFNAEPFFFGCNPWNFYFWRSRFACGPRNAGQFSNFGFGCECHAESR